MSLKCFYYDLKENLKRKISRLNNYLWENRNEKKYLKPFETKQILDPRHHFNNLIEDKKSQQINYKIAYQIDIIIPIYNAFSYLLTCLDSVIKHQDIYRILLIDDRSTDQQVRDFIRFLKKYECDWFIIIENEENMGFVKTVNKAMKLSKNDVVLLNSDTIVTRDWAKKMKKCADSNEKIGTVTPFTNNGTICSIPDFNENNEIPEGYTIDDFADLVEKVSFREYPEIPTAVGFAMYIKRKIIDEIGYFDDESFGKGYGEENDFCMRVIKNKNVNVLCDDTFIYHSGEKSFQSDSNDFKRKNLEVLSAKHPEYIAIVSDFCKRNPLKKYQENIKKRLK